MRVEKMCVTMQKMISFLRWHTWRADGLSYTRLFKAPGSSSIYTPQWNVRKMISHVKAKST